MKNTTPTTNLSSIETQGTWFRISKRHWDSIKPAFEQASNDIGKGWAIYRGAEIADVHPHEEYDQTLTDQFGEQVTVHLTRKLNFTQSALVRPYITAASIDLVHAQPV